MIAITGSVGKSTAKEMVSALLRGDATKKSVRATKKNYNNELGVPLTIFDAEAPGRSLSGWFWLVMKAWLSSIGMFKTCPDVLVLEMGADKPGDIKYLTEIARPDVSIVTAVLPEGREIIPVHRANYESVSELVKEKCELIRAVRTGGTVILNADDESVCGMGTETAEHTLTYGIEETADIRIMSSDIILEEGEYGKIPTGRRVSLLHWGHTYHFNFMGVFGSPVAYAAAAASGVAESTDITSEAIRTLDNRFQPMPGRARIIPGIKYTTLFDDTYNASPAAVLSAVRDLTSMHLRPHQRRIVCLGEMRELGDKDETLHKKVASVCAGAGVDFFVVCGRFAPAMKAAAIDAGMSESDIRVFEDTPEAGKFLQEEIRPGDIILAKASEGPLPSSPEFQKTKGVRMERVIKELMAEPLRAKELLARQTDAWLK